MPEQQRWHIWRSSGSGQAPTPWAVECYDWRILGPVRLWFPSWHQAMDFADGGWKQAKVEIR